MIYEKLIIDTNLLLLLVIGSIDGGMHIKKSSRLGDYNIDDFNTLLDIVEKTKEIYITPYIATEVSNLIDIKGDLKDKAFQICREFFNEFKKVEVDLHIDISKDSFICYGLTDTSLVNLAPKYHILTADNRLLGELFKSCAKNILPYEIMKQKERGLQ